MKGGRIAGGEECGDKAAATPLSVELGSFEMFVGEGTYMPSGVYDLDKIKKWRKLRNCPYYVRIRRVINHQVVP